jgi:drug/metabolite transporter (DMT)-like permease
MAAAALGSIGQECFHYVNALQDIDFATSSASWRPAVSAVIWTGLVPVAYTIVAQSYGQGQGGVRPVVANLIYTIQPLWTALFAYLLLHEALGPAGYLGGILIGSAVLLVVDPGHEK